MDSYFWLAVFLNGPDLADEFLLELELVVMQFLAFFKQLNPDFVPVVNVVQLESEVVIPHVNFGHGDRHGVISVEWPQFWYLTHVNVWILFCAQQSRFSVTIYDFNHQILLFCCDILENLIQPWIIRRQRSVNCQVSQWVLDVFHHDVELLWNKSGLFVDRKAKFKNLIAIELSLKAVSCRKFGPSRIYLFSILNQDSGAYLWYIVDQFRSEDQINGQGRPSNNGLCNILVTVLRILSVESIKEGHTIVQLGQSDGASFFNVKSYLGIPCICNLL